MQIRTFFRQLIAEYSNNDTPSPIGDVYLDYPTPLPDDQLDRKATTPSEGEDATTTLDILVRVRAHSSNSADRNIALISSMLILFRSQVLDRGRSLGRLSNRTLGGL